MASIPSLAMCEAAPSVDAVKTHKIGGELLSILLMYGYRFSQNGLPVSIKSLVSLDQLLVRICLGHLAVEHKTGKHSNEVDFMILLRCGHPDSINT